MRITQFHHARFDHLSRETYAKHAQCQSKSVLTFDRCRPRSVTLSYPCRAEVHREGHYIEGVSHRGSAQAYAKTIETKREYVKSGGTRDEPLKTSA